MQTASQKIDAILADNPGKSLDDLVAAKKINADQKAAAEKKPALVAQISQLEEQVTQFKKFGQDYEQRAAAEKAALVKSHNEELERVKEEALATHTSTSKKTQDDLLVLSKFLRAAAAKRQNGDEGSNENRAFEGALLQVYGGESSAVAAMQKLISGAEEQVPGVDSEPVDYTCSFNPFAPTLSLTYTLQTPKSNNLPSNSVPPTNPGLKTLLNLKLQQ